LRREHSVKALLQGSSPVLGAIAAEMERQATWRTWLAARLPETLFARITGVVERNAELVIFTESASWGVRLRYAMPDLQAELERFNPRIARVRVRVLPQRA